VHQQPHLAVPVVRLEAPAELEREVTGLARLHRHLHPVGCGVHVQRWSGHVPQPLQQHHVRLAQPVHPDLAGAEGAVAAVGHLGVDAPAVELAVLLALQVDLPALDLDDGDVLAVAIHAGVVSRLLDRVTLRIAADVLLHLGPGALLLGLLEQQP